MKCSACQKELSGEHEMIAMKLYTCECGAEHEVNCREATTYLAQFHTRISILEIENAALKERLQRYNPLEGLGL